MWTVNLLKNLKMQTIIHTALVSSTMNQMLGGKGSNSKHKLCTGPRFKST